MEIPQSCSTNRAATVGHRYAEISTDPHLASHAKINSRETIDGNVTAIMYLEENGGI